jgi:hypothetical protein
MAMLRLKGNREQILALIRKNPQAEQVEILTKPSKIIFLNLLDGTKVKTIMMGRGIARTIPKKVIDALKKSAIEVVITEKKAGRAKKFSASLKKKALQMIRDGIKARRISDTLRIPITTVYYWKRVDAKKLEFCHIPDST